MPSVNLVLNYVRNTTPSLIKHSPSLEIIVKYKEVAQRQPIDLKIVYCLCLNYEIYVSNIAEIFTLVSHSWCPMIVAATECPISCLM